MLLPPLPPTFEAALRDVTAKARDARIAAAERLALPEDDQLTAAAEALCTLARDAHATVRVAAARALGLLELPDDCDDAVLERVSRTLVERLDDADARVREQVTVALGEIGGARHPAIEHALERGLESPHPEVRFQALAGYVETSPAPKLEKVVRRLDDDDAEVRGQAARALGQFEASLARAPLSKALGDAVARVRSEAALALARLGDPACSDALGPALDDAALRHEALDAIGSLKLVAHAERVAAIARWVFGSAVDRLAAARALVRIGDARGVATLASSLRGYRRVPRVLALQIAADLRPAALAEELARLAPRAARADATERGLWLDALTALAPESPAARAALASFAEKSRPA